MISKMLLVGLVALGAGGAIAALGGLVMVGESMGPEPTPAEKAVAASALKEATLVEDAAAVARQNMDVFRTDLQPYLPGGPTDYRELLAASEESIVAAESYAGWLRVAAHDGRITEQEGAEIDAVRERYEAAEDRAHEALMASPAGELVEFQDALLESWVEMGKASLDGELRARDAPAVSDSAEAVKSP